MSIYLGDKKLAGSVKLYSGTGQNTDAAMTQKAATDSFLSTNQITNCITNIPQDIKLEVDINLVTLKAGSKVYVPNGTGDFETVNIERDVLEDISSILSDEFFIFYNYDSSTLEYFSKNYVSSGTTPPTDSRRAFYNTSTNEIHIYASGVMGAQLSLPIATIKSIIGHLNIGQVFNGLGYIGSTVFALPGVRGLIPNGRNEDGTLKNTAFEISSVKTNTSGVSANYTVGLNRTAILLDSTASYSEQENYNGGYSRNYAFVGNLTNTSGVISNFNIKTTFHAVDYNDSEYIAHNAMPSSRYVNLTLGTSGSTYTAPADGYVYFERGATSGNKYISLTNTSNGMSSAGITISGISNAKIFLPVKKGDVFRADYNADTANPPFRFIYAEGAA